MRIIKAMEEKYRLPALELVEEVFTDSECEENGKLVRSLVEEIRGKRFYLPELELIMVDEQDSVIGYVNFSRFHLDGKYEEELLLLSPVAVKTEFQRRHISKELIEYSFEKAKELGYKAVIVEGNPMNYRNPGFRHLRSVWNYRPRIRGIARAGMPDGEGTGPRRPDGNSRTGCLQRLRMPEIRTRRGG